MNIEYGNRFFHSENVYFTVNLKVLLNIIHILELKFCENICAKKSSQKKAKSEHSYIFF